MLRAFTAMVLVIAVAAPLAAQDAGAVAGKRVVFLGDSITQSGGSVTFVAYYLELKATPAPDQLDRLKRLGARIQLNDRNQVVGVNLGERRITDVDLMHLQGLEHLQELDLTRTPVTSAGLVHLKDLKTLKKLFLTETKVDDAGITSLKGLKNLETLGLSGTKIGDQALAQLQTLTGLKSIFCIGTGVTDAAVAKFQKALPQCRVTH
jgi:hypothetical protein